MYRLLSTVVILLSLFVCCPGYAIETGQDAPDFSLTDLSGKEVSISEFKGKVIILDFFASWCPPCKKEVPDFIELQKTYGDKDFTMLGVSLVDQAETKGFAKKTGINYPVLVDDNTASEKYGPMPSIPTTFVIGKDFKIAKIYIGYRSKDVFEKDVQELLK